MFFSVHQLIFFLFAAVCVIEIRNLSLFNCILRRATLYEVHSVYCVYGIRRLLHSYLWAVCNRQAIVHRYGIQNTGWSKPLPNRQEIVSGPVRDRFLRQIKMSAKNYNVTTLYKLTLYA